MNDKVARRLAGKRELSAKWPTEVKTGGGRVTEGRRLLVTSNDKPTTVVWRSRKGAGFWVTARGYGVYFGKTLHDATLLLAQQIEDQT